MAMAVPPDVQAELAVRAAAAGRHLLLDKPLALSLDGADKVAEAVAAGGVASLVFFTLRFLPEVAAWMEETGVAGGWHGGDGAWLGTALEPGSPFADSPWRRRKGALWDLGPHLLALAIPTLGPVERVTAGTGLGDTVHLVLGHEGGASSTLALSQTVPPAAEGRSFQLYGPQGRSAVPPFELAHLVALDEAIRQFVAMVAAGATTHPCDVRLGRDTVAVLDAAERFLSTGPDPARPASSARRAAPADGRGARAAGTRGRWRRPRAGRTARGPARPRSGRARSARGSSPADGSEPGVGHEAADHRGHDRPQAGDDPAQAADRADELVARGPQPRQPHQDHAHDPAKERDHQHDEGDHLEPGGGRPGGPRRDAEALAGLGGDVGRVAEAFQQVRTPASVSGSSSARAAAMCSPTSSRSSWRRLAGRSWSSASSSWR